MEIRSRLKSRLLKLYPTSNRHNWEVNLLVQLNPFQLVGDGVWNIDDGLQNGQDSN